MDIKNRIITALGGDPLDFGTVREEYRRCYAEIRPFITELFPIVQEGLKAGRKFLLEQAMGSGLDPDWGTYPFVTASTTLASAATGGLGIPPGAISRVIGVTKAYTTRVGAGPMPTEIKPAQPGLSGLEQQALRAFQEVAATTGRTRRAGWFDAELTQFAARVNGVAKLFLTKLDVLSGLEEIKICTGYELDGKRVRYFDVDSYALERVKPIFRSRRGWKQDIRGVRKYRDLPAAARAYVETIERLAGVPVGWVANGPEREAVMRVTKER